MAILPENSSDLDLTISVAGFSSSPPSGLDINQMPLSESSGEEEEEEHVSNGNDVAVVRPRKKLRLTREQSRLLEDTFSHNHTLNPKQKEALAKQLMLRPRQIEVWFQNRRARSKLKQTEMECEYLKRWYGSLTEHNRRLKREVEELRGVKVVAPFSAATSSMCPRCERVTTAASAIAAFGTAETLLPPQEQSDGPQPYRTTGA